jgi:hypothetical protein
VQCLAELARRFAILAMLQSGFYKAGFGHLYGEWLRVGAATAGRPQFLIEIYRHL